MSESDVYLSLENVESWSGRTVPQRGQELFSGQVLRFNSDDILFGKLRPYLAKVTRPSYSGVCVGEFLVFRCNRDLIEPSFLEALMRSVPMIDLINSSTYGAQMPRASWDFIRDIPVAMPPLDEQRLIVRYLDHHGRKVNAFIRAKRRLIALLTEQKQAIIHQAVTRGLDLTVPLKPSGIDWLGDIPEHWELRRIASISSHLGNGFVGPTRDILKPNGVPYLQSLHVKNGEIRFAKPYFVSSEWLDGYARIRLKAGDVVVVQTGDIGQVAEISPKFEGAGCHALIIVRTDEQLMIGAFLSLLLRSRFGYNSLRRVQTGALHPHLNCTWVREIPVPVPSLPEQRGIAAYLETAVSCTDQLIASSRKQVSLVEEYRARLIAEVVTGKLDVRRAAANMPLDVDFDEPGDEGDEDALDQIDEDMTNDVEL